MKQIKMDGFEDDCPKCSRVFRATTEARVKSMILAHIWFKHGILEGEQRKDE